VSIISDRNSQIYEAGTKNLKEKKKEAATIQSDSQGSTNLFSQRPHGFYKVY
jgi:hypothetical protein